MESSGHPRDCNTHAQTPAEVLTSAGFSRRVDWDVGMLQRRGRLLIAVAGLAVVVSTWFAVRTIEQRRFDKELEQARRDFAARRFASARAELLRLAERRADHGEVEYLLGTCEKIAGHPEAALKAWRRVPAGATEVTLSTLSRARLALELGQYRLSETCLESLRSKQGEVGDEARRLLEWLYWITGQWDEHRALVRQYLERAQDPALALRALWSSEFDYYPVGDVTRTLTTAHARAPDDDRVWLGLANLALRQGRFDEAGHWLTRCEQAAPDDPAVLRCRLDWAEAAGRPEDVARLASRLPASALTPERLLRLRAWLASVNGDRQAERSVVEQLVALRPSDSGAWERLAELALQAGEGARAAEVRHRKAAAAAALGRYYKLLIESKDSPPPPTELARAAEACGRWVDARAWWRYAAQGNPSLAHEANAAVARLDAAAPPPTPAGRSLADVLGPVRRPQEPDDKAVAGRFVVPRFVDEAASRALNFTLDHGPTPEHQMPETMSGGVGFLDYDGDGWLDVYAVQGGPFPPTADRSPFGDRLFRNHGDGTFEDATAPSGLAAFPGGYGHGVAVADYDNDGRPDLFVTRWRSYALYHNRGGRFEDVTESAGLGGDRDWPTSAAWADLDGDGDLDLYVCHYLVWDAANPTLCGIQGKPETEHGYCDPRRFTARADHVFRNDHGRFVDVTAEAGIVDRDGRGLGVVAADLDDDGKVDLFVANDTTANYFFRNLGGFRFQEQGEESGLSGSSSGGYLAGMGVACGDLDSDGRIDLAVTNFFGESTTLYHNHGRGLFSDHGVETGLAAATRMVLGFGLAALDANNDGWLDLAQANGHVEDYRPKLPYTMHAQLILGTKGGGMVDASKAAGPPWQVLRVARGLAVGDIDNDGRLDVLLASQRMPLALLHNQCDPPGHFLTLALEGVESNRDGVGAKVTVTSAGRKAVAVRFGGGSYLSASDPRLHFGLGVADAADRVDVTWPSGRHDRYEHLAADAGYRLREGDPQARPLPGFQRER